MKYALLVYSPEEAWTKDEWSACVEKSTAICHDLQAKGQFIAASPLDPIATATSVRIRQGQTLITAGPFAETVEQFGGFFLIDVPNLDDAMEVAQQLPAAKKGTVEIRPIYELTGLPPDQFGTDQHAKNETSSLYVLLCYDDEQAWKEAGPPKLDVALAEAVELSHRLNARGQYITASPLQPTSTATSVRVQEGCRLITDGPFAETREVLGGYYLVVARDLNEAISIAAQHPGAPHGTVEIRRLVSSPLVARPPVV